MPLTKEGDPAAVIDTYPDYFKKIRGLLSDDGVFLNHGITRRAKR